MGVMRGAMFGLLGGAVGVLIWAGIAWATGWTAPIVAIVVGGIVGFCVGMGNGGRGGVAAGTMAGAVTIVLSLAGRWAATDIVFFGDTEERAQSAEVREESALEALCTEEYDRFLSEGYQFVDGEDGEWPVAVTAAAQRRWDSMDEVQRGELLAAQGWDVEDMDAGARAGIGILVSVLTLRWFDLICLGLAAGTAYKGASRNVKAEVDLLNGQAGVIRVEAPAGVGSPLRGKPPAADEEYGSQRAAAGVFATLGRAMESKSDSPRPERPAEQSGGADESRRAA